MLCTELLMLTVNSNRPMESVESSSFMFLVHIQCFSCPLPMVKPIPEEEKTKKK